MSSESPRLSEAYKNVAETLVASALRVPNRPAVKFKQRMLTYEQLNGLVNKIARALGKSGIGKGDRVGYVLPNGIAIIALYYAIQKLGAVAVPIPYRFLPNEISLIAESCGAAIIVCEDSREEDLREAAKVYRGGNFPPALPLRAVSEMISNESSDEVGMVRDASLLSRIQYTGGSTGIPKGAARTHSADLVEFDGVIGSNGMGERDDNVVLIQSPLEHHGGHSWFTTTLALGATLVLCGKFDPLTILGAIERERVTHILILPPTSYERLLAHPKAQSADLSSVRLVQSSAGAAYRSAIEAIFDAFPNAILNYGWGQSESGLGTSIAFTREMLQEGSDLLSSIGRPMPGMELRIVDEAGKDVPPGEEGEALARSGALMDGYWGKPDLTAASFMGEWLRTGDIMRQDGQGYYYLVSRKKDVIKSGGENVFASEVEAALLAHPDIADCMVFGVADPIMVEAVAAVVETKKGASLTKEDVQAWCKSCIASYKKPRYVVFKEDLGRNDAGKINRESIMEYFSQHCASAQRLGR